MKPIFILSFILLIIVIVLLFGNFKKGSPLGKRLAPKVIEPVIYNNAEYSVPHFVALTEGMKHNGGYVEAKDIKTGKRLWLKEVYSPNYKPNLEKDVQDVLIISMKLVQTKDQNKLVIINEANKTYEIKI